MISHPFYGLAELAMIAGVRDFDVEDLVEMARQAFAQGTYLVILDPQKLTSEARKRIQTAGRRHVNFRLCRAGVREDVAAEPFAAGDLRPGNHRNTNAGRRKARVAESANV
jgi:hypothetical protein